ncbi:MAG: hypothetical protein CMP55_01040 [Flavobacteriales bacterium]|nr:hypothetical protein [Flavobacteriales bacterium]|tara:strand:- start:3785 stop:7498 length:3714 start_codon:yes stop_codon:yes gene_type:complete
MYHLLTIFFISITYLNLCGQDIQYHFLDYRLENDIITINDSKSQNFIFQFNSSDCNTNVEVNINNVIYVACDSSEINIIKDLNIDSIPILSYTSGFMQKHLVVRGEIFPYVIINNHFKKILFLEIELSCSNSSISKNITATVDNSVLSSGNWYKISLNNDGIYRLSYQDLENLGINLSNLNPQDLRIYGHPGGLLPIDNNTERTIDLEELAIQVVGQDDGVFNENDYILFYGQSPNQWIADEAGLFRHKQHYYDNSSYYFITADLGEGKRINSFQSLSYSDTVITSFDDYKIHENDEINFIKSGLNWYGDVFDSNDSKSFSFNFPNRIDEVNLKIALAANSVAPYNSDFTINASGILSQNVSISGISGSYNKANIKVFENKINPTSDEIEVELEFNSLSNLARGYIDYIEINAHRNLKMSGNQMSFRSLSSVKSNSISQFQLSNFSEYTKIWDVTSPLSPQLIDIQSSGSISYFNILTDTLKEFIAFNETYLSSSLIGKVANQNLHSFRDIDYLIVAPNLFLEQANRLANFHRNNNLNVEVVTPKQIFNEFSSGRQDVSAIRDFAKMLYEQENPLKYLLLFGDASYDPKERLPNNTNYVISYQSANSTNELYSYVSDDFFALLDNEESILSNSANIPFLDIGVGRFPVQTEEEAKIVVDKVISYNSNESYGDWRLNMCFVGDDNDEIETVHSLQAEQLADFIAINYPSYNVDKIYLDAYQQESSTGGQRCASVNNAISDAINKGMFLVNYTGHGGELGWAHERILEIDDINSWRNANKLPLFMTATCEFSRYDDPARVSAGEQVFLKENGGAIALLTTSRVVFTGSNLDLNTSFLENIFTDNQNANRLGDVLIRTKNNVVDVSNTNHRNFTLLGDPALQLAYPKYNIVLNQIPDSAKALGMVNISGEIQSNGIKLKNFNGIVYPKVYDKRRDYQTLGQDESPVFVFDLQKNLIFKGKSSVENGEFSFSFIVPKDINYDYGTGKVSLYAKGLVGDKLFDAYGHNLDIVIGGTSSEYIEDFEGPQIELFMNDTNFIFGGITDNNPSLYAVLYDESGINTVGNGIGHDMLAILDEESANPIVLNDFYESDINSFRRGIINYPFNTLSEGKHTLTARVWDVHNNSSQETLEFMVISSNNLTIQNLLNYPNPVIDYTSFYFDHNQNNEEMSIVLKILDLNGNIVKEIKDNIIPNGYKYGPIQWNGKSDSGAKLKPGVYVFSLFASLKNGEISNNTGRLILIN